ncbi:hypothetical protein AB0368_19165 [Actinoplanes sp. NPDC051475]|uniref:hypothetical protein n=1 Tax=Actinoplanes sp. NPDC051475 TaxID=3157225 RepID=UPI00344EF4E1
MAVAGCTPKAKAATASSAASNPADQIFADGCPSLSAPPFGIEAKGERRQGQTGPSEQRTLNRLVPGAQMDYVICQYSKPGSAQPGIEVDVRAFRGQSGTAQATALADAEQVSSSGFSADFVTVPASGDNGGFAWFDEGEYGIATHSGNAYVMVMVNPGGGQKALQKQVPSLTAVMADVLDVL